MHPTLKWVLAAIAIRAADTGRAEITKQGLLNATGLGERTVDRALQSAESQGVVSVNRRLRRSWIFKLLTARAADIDSITAAAAVISRTPAVARVDAQSASLSLHYGEGEDPPTPQLLPTWVQTLAEIKVDLRKGQTPLRPESVGRLVKWAEEKTLSADVLERTALAVKAKWPGTNKDVRATFQNWAMRPERRDGNTQGNSQRHREGIATTDDELTSWIPS